MYNLLCSKRKTIIIAAWKCAHVQLPAVSSNQNICFEVNNFFIYKKKDFKSIYGEILRGN